MDQDAARELKLFTENDADIYRQRTTPIVRNLRTKQARGTYDREKAVTLFMYLAEAGARKYAREYGDGEANWSRMFPKDVRLAVSREWRDEFEQESALGNYDNETYLPKKYLQPAKTSPKRSSRSKAYENGKRDAIKWIREADPLPRSLHAIVDPLPGTLTPTERLIQTAGHTAASKKLGIPTNTIRGYDPRKTAASSEYDAGYLDACRRALGAMEGN